MIAPRCIAAIGFALALAAASPEADAQASGCRKAASPAEHDICADPALRAADARMNADYAAVRTAARLNHLDAALLAGQRAWLANRNRRCAVPSCLAARTAERGSILAALAARISDANPTLFNLQAVWLDGRWIADAPAPDTFGKAAALEPAGARLTAHVGEMCDGNTPQDCAPFALEPSGDTLGSGAGWQDLPATFGVPPQTPVYTVTRGNGGGYSLAAPEDGRLIAFAPACAAGGSPCGFVHQAWRPVDSASRLHLVDAGR